MSHELLGKHKASSEWYTPDCIWSKIYKTFGIPEDDPDYLLSDPCPKNHLVSDGLRWLEESSSKYIYVNPPTPAAPWAKKCIEHIQQNPNTFIIFAAFSEAVLWQVPELLDYPICWVRNRINWIDGNKHIKAKESDCCAYTLPDGNWYVMNHNYLKPSKAPRNYNAFALLSHSENQNLEYYDIERRFCCNFSDMGTIQLSRTVYTQLAETSIR